MIHASYALSQFHIKSFILQISVKNFTYTRWFKRFLHNRYSVPVTTKPNKSGKSNKFKINSSSLIFCKVYNTNLPPIVTTSVQNVKQSRESWIMECPWVRFVSEDCVFRVILSVFNKMWLIWFKTSTSTYVFDAEDRCTPARPPC